MNDKSDQFILAGVVLTPVMQMVAAFIMLCYLLG